MLRIDGVCDAYLTGNLGSHILTCLHAVVFIEITCCVRVTHHVNE